MRCVVCHKELEEGDFLIECYIFTRRFIDEMSQDDIDEYDVVVCSKAHLIEYIDKTVEKR